MRDVANAANVSQSTVSRILNPSSTAISISEETKQRVLKTIERLGYHPNIYAGSLRGQKTRMIAMMIADISNTFYHPMVRAVQDIAHQHSYDVMIANSDHLRENEELFCASLMRRPVDGVILVPYHLTASEIDMLIARTGAAVVVLGSHIEHPQVDVVFGDDGQKSYEAVKWLIECRGHRRIGAVTITPAFSAGQRRHAGFLRALAEAGLEAPPEFQQQGDWSLESGRRAAQAILSLPNRPTAIFAFNDYMAIGSILAAQNLGLRVPEDVAIVGFDNIPEASWVQPALTTVAQYPLEFGQQMGKLVFERIEGLVKGPKRCVEVPCRLIERQST
jgi:DNA-binding LacI/PurR family transcriptional regulator